VNLDALLALTPEGTLIPTRPLDPEERAAIRERIPPGSAARTDLIRRRLRAMDAAAFDALTEAAVDARAASGLTWQDEPWATWGHLLNNEGDARQQARPRPLPALDKRASQRDRILAALRERGPAGVLNTELNDVGFRFGARIHELREEGFVIRTDQLEAQVFRFVLVAEPGLKAA
jgi:hypothetical protein